MTIPLVEQEIEFLRNAANALRAIAVRAPDIAAELERLADEAEAQADRLERARGAGPAP